MEKLSNYHVGDILLLQYGTFKQRPGSALLSSHHLFVVVDAENVCPISSNQSKVSSKYPYNILIKDWSTAGLSKPSHVKTDSYGEISDTNVFKYIGHLSDEDKNNVLSSYQNSPQNYILEWCGINYNNPT